MPALRGEGSKVHNPTASLIGRAEELRQITWALDDVAHGRGFALFLVGEPGIGKTRLAHEALNLARRSGFQCLEGRAYPLEGGLAYASLLDAVGPLLRSFDSRRRGQLVRGLPDLGRLFSDLELPDPPPLGDPALEKTRMFEAVARLMERLAREAPLVLFIDDLHCADPATIELLHYLARGLRTQRMLLLGTYRADVMDRPRGLLSLTTSLQKVGLAKEILVSRLASDAVAGLAAQVLGGEVPDTLVALLMARAAGTPLFVEALVRSLIDSGRLVQDAGAWALRGSDHAPLPPGVRGVILEHLQQLEPQARRVLDLVAVNGDTVLHAVLCSASRLDEDTLLAIVRELRTTGLAAEEVMEGGVSYRLTHPLIQEVAYTELPEMARRRMHAALAAALEQTGSGDLELLAHHYRCAGDEAGGERALEVLLAAGQRAREVYANDQAARHLGAALVLLRKGVNTGGRPDLLALVLEWLGEAWERVGERGAAVAVWTEAEAEYDRLGKATAVARLRDWLAAAEWQRGHFAGAQEHLALGEAALQDSPPSPELADLLHTRLILLSRLGDQAGMAETAERLLALAEQIGSPRVKAEAYLAEAELQLGHAEYDAAKVHLISALEALAGVDEAVVALRIHHMLATVAAMQGDHRAERLHAEQSLNLARRLGAPTLELNARAHIISADKLAGDWAAASRRSAEALGFARRVASGREVAVALLVRAHILVPLGDLDGAADCMGEVTADYQHNDLDGHLVATIQLGEAHLAAELGDFARAQALAAECARIPEALPLLALSLLAETQARAGAPEEALDTVAALRAGSAGHSPYCEALAAYAEGLARHVLGDIPGALDCLEGAAGSFEALAIPFEAALARLEWAVVAQSGEPQLAAVAARESLDVFEQLGARQYAARARQLLRQLGAPVPGKRRPQPARATLATGTPATATSQLSSREMEVARLVAAGLTNAEIAAHLVVSVRTVTTHLEHIYSRLGFSSRASLTRYVLEAAPLEASDQNT